MDFLKLFLNPNRFILYFSSSTPDVARQAAPVTSTAQEVTEAKRQEKKSLLQRQGFADTILAGKKTFGGNKFESGSNLLSGKI